MPDNYTHANYWGAIFRGKSNTTPVNTLVQIRNTSMWVLYNDTNLWIELQNQKSKLGGASYSPTYNAGGAAPQLNQTIEGAFIKPAPGCIWHFWNGGSYRPIRYNNIKEILVNTQVRLVLKDPNGTDDMNQADYLVHLGADWRDPNDPNCAKTNYICTSFGISKFKKISNEWINCTFHSITKKDIDNGIPLPPLGIFFNVTNSIPDLIPSNSFNSEHLIIYPNPVIGNELCIKLFDTFKAEKLEIFDIHGRNVRFEIVESSDILKIKLTEHISNGLYLIKLICNNKIKIGKFYL